MNECFYKVGDIVVNKVRRPWNPLHVDRIWKDPAAGYFFIRCLDLNNELEIYVTLGDALPFLERTSEGQRPQPKRTSFPSRRKA